MKRLLALFAALMLMSGCAQGDYAVQGDGFRVVMPRDMWDGLDKTHCGYADADALLRAAADALTDIARETGEDAWLTRYAPGGGIVTMTLFTTPRISHTEGGYRSRETLVPAIYLNEAQLAHGFAPIAHELTHVVCQDYVSLSLREGLASYMNDKIGLNPAVFNYGMDPDLLCRDIALTGDDRAELLRETGAMTVRDDTARSELRDGYYLCAYSFARYLINTYGMAAFMRVYSSDAGDAAYEAELGKDLDALRQDWLAHIDSVEGGVTRDEYDAYMASFYAEHGLPQE